MAKKKVTKSKVTRKTNKPKKDAWFVATRGSYIPCTWQGWLAYLPFVAFLILAFAAAANLVVNDMNNLGWALLVVILCWAGAFGLMTWAAKRTS